MSLFSTIVGASSEVQSARVLPEGVDFDGTYDYLSRSSDLVGNIDSSTFTFSAWVYRHRDAAANQYIYSTDDGLNVQFGLYFNTSNQLVIVGKTGSTVILASTVTSPLIAKDTFLHILISLDLTKIANRHVYINDIPATVTWGTYTSSALYFTNNSHTIGGFIAGSRLQGRLSYIFLDYTYRNLSIEANRRLFITADGKPANEATLKALNPIMYFKMKDSATAHVNSGTGGDMLQAGTIATSERGANQDNCVASYFNGSTQYLSRTSLTGITDTKTLTISANISCDGLDTDGFFFPYINGTGGQNLFYVTIASAGGFLKLYMSIKDAATNSIARYDSLYEIPVSSTVSIQISFDLTNILHRHIVFNGKLISSGSWSRYDNITIPLATANNGITILRDPVVAYGKGNIGELYFDTSYIDLATNNPFWDSETNKPIPVRKAMANLGSNPLICMPLDASNPGKNYGSGGDFTVNSAPYVGARGGSEFWARSATRASSASNYLNKTNLVGAVDSKSFSCVLAFSNQSGTAHPYISFNGTNFRLSSNNNRMYVTKQGGIGTNGDFYWSLSGTENNSAWHIIHLSVDTLNQLFVCYENNITLGTKTSQNGTVDTTTIFDIGDSNCVIFGDLSVDKLALCYFTTDYIDFSQEVNRLKFVDGLGYPLDLAKQIDAGIIPKPLIYLPFDDPSNLGKNLGTGGDFTVNGTVTVGADVLG